MGFNEDNIVQLAKDICLHQLYAHKTNDKGNVPYREADDGLPFGFDYQGCAIEVHVNIVMRRVKGTGVFAKVPVMNIYGVLKDGRLHPIANKVSAIEGVVE